VITATRLVLTLLALCAGLSATLMAQAEPEADRLALRAFFAQRFPVMPFEDYVLGSFMLNPDGRRHYEDIMAFPPFEVDIDRGRALWERPFRSGGTYARCLPSAGRNIAGHYPRYDEG